MIDLAPPVSLWSRISDALSGLRQGEGLSSVFDRLKTPPERSVAFTIAVIALGAKLAKADGVVTRNEVTAFREVFTIAPGDEANAARVYNMARKDVAGYELYAARIGKLFADDIERLRAMLEGLFHIALADGEYHPREDEMLQDVARIFGLPDIDFKRIRGLYVPGAEQDPYDVLGVSPEASAEELRAAWRKAIRECHPDKLIAQGLPEEAVQLGEKRLVAVNRAWEQLNAEAR